MHRRPLVVVLCIQVDTQLDQLLEALDVPDGRVPAEEDWCE